MLNEIGRVIIVRDEKVEMLLSKRIKTVASRCFYALKESTIRFRRRSLVEKVETMDTGYFTSKKRNIMHVLSAISLGTSSRKKILERRADSLARARTILTDKLTKKNEEHGIITIDMLQGEMRRIFNSEVSGWFRRRYLQNSFTALKFEMKAGRENIVVASQYCRKKVGRQVFIQWRKLTLMPSSKSMLLHYNCAEVELFGKLRLFRFIFRPWKSTTAMLCRAKRLRRNILTRLAIKYFHAWNKISSHQGIIRGQVISLWKNYRCDTVGEPFRTWRDCTRKNIKLRQDRERFLFAYKRLQERRILWGIFRTWRHLARYGRETGLYNRKELIRKNERQAEVIRILEIQLSAYIKEDATNGGLRLESKLIASVPRLNNVLYQKENNVRTLKRQKSKIKEFQATKEVLKNISSDAMNYVASRLPLLPQHTFDVCTP